MGWFGVALALGLPWLAGALWLRLLWREPVAGVWPLALGYGYLLSLLGVTLLLRGFGMAGLPFALFATLLLFALLAAMAVQRLRQPVRIGTGDNPGVFRRLPVWQQILFALLLLWLGARLLGLALEVWWEPLFPWDAWTTWAVRARVWSELQQLAPFVSAQDWLADPGASAYTIAASGYPETVSLLALWPTLGYGGWNETAANLPWLGCALALGLGFYGQARLWGASPLTSLVLLWLLLSLPLLNTHVALAGYADLWLATTLGLALIALLHWARDGDWRQGLLALVLALACPLIKQEGLVWLLLLLAALFAARLSGRGLLWLVSAAAVIVLAIGLRGGLTVEIPVLGALHLAPNLIEAPGLGRFEFSYHDTWEPVARNLFVYGSWHLFAYLLTAAAVWSLIETVRQGAAPWQRAGLTFVLGSLLALFVLFFLTNAHLWAAQSTSINRLLLHFAPAFVFWMLTLWAGRDAAVKPTAHSFPPSADINPSPP